jgi:membrane glycosyltransferase
VIKQSFYASRLPASVKMTRWLLAVLTLTHTVIATGLFSKGIASSAGTALSLLLSSLFALLFGIIAFSFWMAIFGFVQRIRDAKIRSANKAIAESKVWRHRMKPIKTAILIPVYNEEPTDVYAGVLAMRRSLIDRCSGDEFAFFILSDTTNAEVALAEEQLWSQIIEDNNVDVPIYYRRREKNIGRKSGNLEDFCVRWGSQYTYMVVLDADSLMDGATIQAMVDRMDVKRHLGILQVPPVPINRGTWLARLQQFAANMYGPVFTKGLDMWANVESNYWGHNAIIRVEPFMQHCGLPVLPGVAPLGGEILSHDFVEAALMLRSGWGVELATDLGGSYEECPTNLLDYVIRDQRWCQGNLQHSRLVLSEGFHPTSRFHMAMGVLAYASSPLWMLFLLATIWVTTTSQDLANESDGSWLQSIVFAMTLGMLFIPKVWGWLDAVLSKRQRQLQGGAGRMLLSMIGESLVSCLLAPTMMIYHSRFVVNTLRGKKITWNRQNRDEKALEWQTAWSHFGWISLLGLFSTVCVLAAGWTSLWWFLPITIGWACIVPLAVFTSSVFLGRKLQSWGLFLIPEETELPPVLQYKRSMQQSLETLTAVKS